VPSGSEASTKRLMVWPELAVVWTGRIDDTGAAVDRGLADGQRDVPGGAAAAAVADRY